jgi:hypothetical protein
MNIQTALMRTGADSRAAWPADSLLTPPRTGAN